MENGVIQSTNFTNDEHVASMFLVNSILTILNGYVSKVKDLTEEFDRRAVQHENNKEAQLKNCQDKHSQQLSQLASAHKSILEKAEKEYKNILEEQSRKETSYREAKKRVESNSSQYQADVSKQATEQKAQLDRMLASVKEQERRINTPRYKKIQKTKSPIVEMNVLRLSDIIALRPKELVDHINELHEKFIRRIIKISEINKKCLEYFTLCLKAEQFHSIEIEIIAKTILESHQKANRMISDATVKFNREMEKHEIEVSSSRKAYVNKCTEINARYDNERKSLIQTQLNQKQDLAEQHHNQDEKLKSERQRVLMETYQFLQTTMLNEVPPEKISRIVQLQHERKLTDKRTFIPATFEPENVTVGRFLYKLEKVLNNKLISRFMLQNYSCVIENGCFVFPFTIGLNQNLALFFKYNSAQSHIAQEHIQNLCLNVFLETPPNKMRFHFIDPLKSGQSFAIFKHFEDDLQSSYNIILGGIQTDTASVEQQLQIVVDHIKNMQINTFKGQYKNIREYNASNVLNPQPYNIIGIMDFPAGFSPRSIDLLQQIVATGKKCGVYAIVMCDINAVETSEQKIKNQIKIIEDASTVYQLRNEHYIRFSNGKADENLQFYIDKLIQINQILTIAPIMKKGIKDAGRIVIDYEHIAPKTNKRFSFTNDEGLVIPIGMSGASDIQYLTLGIPGSQSVHALIGGQIGSGKSRLLHSIITGSILQYPPEELEIYLVDFKSGTEFKIYADYNLPNFKVIALESEQEFGLSVLQHIMQESDRRARIFNSCSKSDITTYNNRPEAEKDERLPRILVVIDEFHELFSGVNTEVTSEASRLLDNILRLKRSFGVHVILCTQSVRGLSEVDEAAMAQIAVRIALKCPKEDADILLGRGSDALAQIEENDAGSAIYLQAISTPKTNNKFRVGYISQDKHMSILSDIESHYQNSKNQNSTRVLVSDVSDSRGNVFQEYVKRGNLIVEPLKIHIGESLNIDNTLVANFSYTKNCNMLLAGKDYLKAQSLMYFILLDLMLQKLKSTKSKTTPTKIVLFDFGSNNNYQINVGLQELALLLPDFVEFVEPSDAVTRLGQIHEEYRTALSSQKNVWILINNLGFATDFQSSIYSNNHQGYTLFYELLRNGPEKGYFTIAWHDDLMMCRQKFPDIIDCFGRRIAFNMSDDDTINFVDFAKDPSINKNNAVYFEAGRGKQKFRPYSIPIQKWVDAFIFRISGEGN